MKRTPTLEEFSYEDKKGHSLADKILRSKGVKRGHRFDVGDGYLNIRSFFLTVDGYLLEVVSVKPQLTNGIERNEAFISMDEERYEYLYKAIVLGRGHLWKKNQKKNK